MLLFGSMTTTRSAPMDSGRELKSKSGGGSDPPVVPRFRANGLVTTVRRSEISPLLSITIRDVIPSSPAHRENFIIGDLIGW